MNILSRLNAGLKNPRFLILFLLHIFNYYFKNDKKYLQLCYRFERGGYLDLDNPKTFNEKIQWLKLYYHNPLLTGYVDKYKAKELVANKIGWECIIPTYGVWDCFEDIDFDKLPSQFVLKTTHGGQFRCCCLHG